MRRSRVAVIRVGADLKWDLSETERQDREAVLRQVAEQAIELAERAGADSDELEILSMLLESAK